MENEFDFNEPQILISVGRNPWQDSDDKSCTVGLILPNGCDTSGFCIGRADVEGRTTMNVEKAKWLIKVLQEFVEYNNSLMN